MAESAASKILADDTHACRPLVWRETRDRIVSRTRAEEVRFKPRFKYRQRASTDYCPWQRVPDIQTVGAEQRKARLAKSVLANRERLVK